MEIVKNKNKKKVILRLLKKDPLAYLFLSKEDKILEDISLEFIKHYYNKIGKLLYNSDFFDKDLLEHKFFECIKAIPKELKENKEFALKAMEKNSLFFLSLDKKLKKDVEILKVFFTHMTERDLQNLQKLYETNKQFHHFLMLSFKENNIKNDKFLDCIIPQGYRNKDYILLELSEGINFVNNRKNVEEGFYNSISNTLKKSKVFNLKLLKKNSKFIAYVNDELKKDVDIIRQVLLSNDTSGLRELPKNILSDNILLSNVLKDINYISPNLLGRELIKELKSKQINPDSPKEICEYLNKKILMLELTKTLNMNKKEIVIKKSKI